MTDRGDGTYTIQFVPPHEGTTSVHVMLDGVHVRGSPMAVSVHRDIDELARGALTGKLSSAVTGLRRGLAATRCMQNSLRSEAEGLLQYVPVLVQSAASDLSKLMVEQQVLLKEAREAVHREGGERRRLHNLVQELRGNIRVYVRVKPLTADEAATGMTPVLKCSYDASRIECNAGTSTKAFDFDRVFHQASTQQQVFSEVASLVTSALDGCAR
jgi:kinesin family member C2/C3